MKKLFPMVVIGLIIIGGIEASAISNNQNNNTSAKIESILVSEPKIVNSGAYQKIELEESTSSIIYAGKPMLPVVTKVFTLPFGSKNIGVDVSFSEENEMFLSKQIQPCPSAIPVNSDMQLYSKPVKDQEIYQSNDIFPQERFSYSIGAGLDGEEHVIYLSVKCHPVRYIPTQNKILYSENIDIKIVYNEPEQPVQFPDEYDLLIIAPNEFSSALQPLIDHKNHLGMNTILKTLESIYSQYTGADNQEKIKYCIKDSIETLGISHVLLVGGMIGQKYDWYLPVRYTNNHAGKPLETSFISDLYFADIYKVENEEVVFEDWDSNGNGVYAEFISIYNETSELYEVLDKDILDCRPDVNVGRLACRSVEEVNLVVDKIINYEETPADPLWFNRFVLMAGDTYPNAEEPDAYEAEIDTELSASYMAGFDIVKLWTSLETLKGQSDAEKEINTGAGFIHMAGHANPSVLVTNKPKGGGKVTILQMYYMPLVTAFWALVYQGRGIIAAIQSLLQPRNPDLHNGEKLPIIVIGGCHNSQINVTSRNILKFGIPHAYGYGIHASSCFSWYLMTVKNGGAIATMGNTGLGMGLPGYAYTEGLDGWLFPRFFYHYGMNGKDLVGEAYSAAITDYVNEFDINEIDNPSEEDGPGAMRQMVEQWELLGDPCLKMGGY
jgi:hypothetical protein